MKNYITFPTTSGNPHDFVLTTEYIYGIFEISDSATFALKLNNSQAEVIIEHTDDAALQTEFINNIKAFLILYPKRFFQF